MNAMPCIVVLTLLSTLFSPAGFSDQNSLPGDYTSITTMEGIRQYCEFLYLLQKSMDPDSKPWLDNLVKPGSQVLEIGPGLGSMTRYMAARTGQCGHIYALDNNPVFLNEIAATAPNITTIHGDILNYPLEQDKYDAIYARGVIELLVGSDHQAIFQKLANALKKNGQLLIESLVDDNPETRLTQLQTMDKPAYDALLKIFQNSAQYGYLDFAIGHQYQSFFENAGLTVVKARKLQRLVRSGSPEVKALNLSLLQLNKLINEGVGPVEGIDQTILNRVYQALANPDFSMFTPDRVFMLGHK